MTTEIETIEAAHRAERLLAGLPAHRVEFGRSVAKVITGDIAESRRVVGLYNMSATMGGAYWCDTGAGWNCGMVKDAVEGARSAAHGGAI